MIVHEMPLLRQTGDPQQARDRARPRGQNRPEQQHLSMAPTALEKQRREAQNERGEAGWKLKHGSVSWPGRPSLATHLLRRPPHGMAKVELSLWGRLSPQLGEAPQWQAV